MTVSIIVAAGLNGVIGRDNDLPWSVGRLPPDMKWFARKTAGHPVVSGSRTWFSIPEKYRPLDRGRSSIVLSRTLPEALPGVHVARNIQEALTIAEGCPGSDEIFIAGGGQVYADALPYTDRIYKTVVGERPEGDTYFPEHPEIMRETDRFDLSPDFVPRLTVITYER